MALVRLIDRFVMLVEALTAADGRALRLTVGMVLLTVTLIGILVFTVLLAWMGAMP